MLTLNAVLIVIKFRSLTLALGFNEVDSFEFQYNTDLLKHRAKYFYTKDFFNAKDNLKKFWERYFKLDNTTKHLMVIFYLFLVLSHIIQAKLIKLTTFNIFYK